MIVLFETAAGFGLFKVLDESKITSVESISDEYDSESIRKLISLQKFVRFKDSQTALESAKMLSDSVPSNELKSFLQDNIISKSIKESIAVEDPKLVHSLKESLGLNAISNAPILEVMRFIRTHISSLVPDLDDNDLRIANLGLAHAMSRHRLKFSAEKVDTMVVHAVHLLDDLDKELNVYSMRLREWYGWHFPELGKILADNTQYAHAVRALGDKASILHAPIEDFLPPESSAEVREAATISMGTELSDSDITSIINLATQIVELSQYREKLHTYLVNRMRALAPNLSLLVGEIVGARLIAHAGSLLSLAKAPASTVQILGAEKALFRALKSKRDTPKYGLIYHAALVGQTPPKHKGKISRVLAAKAALAIRYDALGEPPTMEDDPPSPEQNLFVGEEGRRKVEMRMRSLEEWTSNQ